MLAAPVSPPARVLGTALGTGGALLLLVLGLSASAMAAVDFGVGGATRPPAEVLLATKVESSEPDAREAGLFWSGSKSGVWVTFSRALLPGETIVAKVRTRGGEGKVPSSKHAVFVFLYSDGPDHSTGAHFRKEVRVPISSPFRVTVPLTSTVVAIGNNFGEPTLGCRAEDIRVEGAPKPRALARGLHAAALLGGLLAVMGAGMALSTVTGAGVGGGGALALALLSLFQPLFADAADTLASAGAMERAIQATLKGGDVAVAQTGTPPALAPVFRAIATVLPDGTRFDLASAIAANEVPWSGDVVRAVGLGLALCAAFLAVAILGARRRP